MAETSNRGKSANARCVAQMRKLPRLKLVQWAVSELGGKWEAGCARSRGFQGQIVVWSPCHHTSDDRKFFAGCRWYPIQVKQADKVGRPDIDSFEATMMREDCDKGFFVGFDFSSDARTEIDKFFKRTGKVIVALTVREILDEEIAMRLA